MRYRKWLAWLLAAALMAAPVFSMAAETAEPAGEPEEAAGGTAELIMEGEELTINAAALTAEPVFIDWAVEDIPMQLIARKDPEGQVRLAFNTCQSCNGSPWAWFEYLGDGLLECQNCGQRMPVSLVGDREAAGCAPIPVPEYTENEDGTVTVPEQVIAEAAHLFANWRKTGE